MSVPVKQSQHHIIKPPEEKKSIHIVLMLEEPINWKLQNELLIMIEDNFLSVKLYKEILIYSGADT